MAERSKPEQLVALVIEMVAIFFEYLPAGVQFFPAGRWPNHYCLRSNHNEIGRTNIEVFISCSDFSHLFHKLGDLSTISRIRESKLLLSYL